MDQFEKLMRLAEFRKARISSRRNHEWKVTLGVWALLAAGIAYRPEVGWPLVFLGLVIVCLGHTLLWVGNHRYESKLDVEMGFYYSDRAHNIAIPNERMAEHSLPRNLLNKKHNCEYWFGFWREPGAWFQIGATVLLSAVLFLRYFNDCPWH